MKHTFNIKALLLSITLTSCAQGPATQKGSIVYLQNVVTKSESPTNKFNSLIKQGNVVVDFYADWCGPCKAVASVINQIASQYPVMFLKVNTDLFRDLSSNIRSIPTLVFYKNGQQVHRQTGAMSQSAMASLLQKLYLK